MAHTTGTAQRCYLPQFPPELRVRTCNYVFGGNDFVRIIDVVGNFELYGLWTIEEPPRPSTEDRSPKFPHAISLLSTCNVVSHETYDVLVNYTTFAVGISCDSKHDCRFLSFEALRLEPLPNHRFLARMKLNLGLALVSQGEVTPVLHILKTFVSSLDFGNKTPRQESLELCLDRIQPGDADNVIRSVAELAHRCVKSVGDSEPELGVRRLINAISRHVWEDLRTQFSKVSVRHD